MAKKIYSRDGFFCDRYRCVVDGGEKLTHMCSHVHLLMYLCNVLMVSRALIFWTRVTLAINMVIRIYEMDGPRIMAFLCVLLTLQHTAASGFGDHSGLTLAEGNKSPSHDKHKR